MSKNQKKRLPLAEKQDNLSKSHITKKIPRNIFHMICPSFCKRRNSEVVVNEL